MDCLIKALTKSLHLLIFVLSTLMDMDSLCDKTYNSYYDAPFLKAHIDATLTFIDFSESLPLCSFLRSIGNRCLLGYCLSGLSDFKDALDHCLVRGRLIFF